MENTFIPKAIELVKQAVAADNENKLDAAYSLYEQSLRYFVTGIKYTTSPSAKDAIEEKAMVYMKRAEELKEAITVRDKPKTSSKTPKEETTEDGDTDPDTAKLVSALSSSIITERPNVPWDAVAGLEQAKSLLKEAVTLPVRFPQLFTGECKPWKGILLYGPPGTGKSFLAKAVATESGASCFMSVSSSDLVSKYQGESERLVKHLFEIARKKAPSIIFIDEIDSMCRARGEGDNDSARRILNEFLTQMDGVGKDNTGVLILGATNTPWALDDGIIRRFEKRVYIPLPDKRARVQVFKTSIGATRNSLTPSDFNDLSAATDGLSGADIGILVRDALYEPIRTCQVATHFKQSGDLWSPCSSSEGVEMSLMDIKAGQLKPPLLELRHFAHGIARTKPSVSQRALKRFEDWTLEVGIGGNE